MAVPEVRQRKIKEFLAYKDDDEIASGMSARQAQRASRLPPQQASDLPQFDSPPPPKFDPIPDEVGSNDTLEKLKEFMPIINVVQTYTKDLFIADIKSGATIAFVLIPQAIAFSTLAGVTPMRALVSAIFPLLFYALFGGSRQLSVGTLFISCAWIDVRCLGPEALSSVLVGLAVVAEVEESGGDPNDIATVLGFIVGLFAIFLSLIRCGFIDNLLSGYVLTGFVTGVANLIIVEQMPAMFGLTFKREEGVSTAQTFANTISAMKTAHPATAIFGVSCLGFLIGMKFFKKAMHKKYPWITSLPEILILVLISAILSIVLDFKEKGIKTLGTFDNKLPTPSFPKLHGFEQIQRLFSSVVLITLVGFIESQTVTRTFGLKHGYFPSGDRELFALGTANSMGALFGSYVTFGSLPRSRIQATSGGKTTLVGIMAATIVLIMATSMGSLLKFLPKSALAAIVMNAGINLIEYEEIFFLFKVMNMPEIFMFLVTWGITLFISIDFGILLSVGLSSLFVLRSTGIVRLGLMGRISYNSGRNVKSTYVDIREYPDAELVKGVMALSVKSSLEFYNASRLARRIEMLLQFEIEAFQAAEANREAELDQEAKSVLQAGSRKSTFFINSSFNLSEHLVTVIIDFQNCEKIDAAAAFVLKKVIKNMQKQQALVYFAGVRPSLKQILDKGGVSSAIGEDHFVMTVADAVDSVKVIFNNAELEPISEV